MDFYLNVSKKDMRKFWHIRDAFVFFFFFSEQHVIARSNILRLHSSYPKPSHFISSIPFFPSLLTLVFPSAPYFLLFPNHTYFFNLLFQLFVLLLDLYLKLPRLHPPPLRVSTDRFTTHHPPVLHLHLIINTFPRERC